MEKLKSIVNDAIGELEGTLSSGRFRTGICSVGCEMPGERVLGSANTM